MIRLKDLRKDRDLKQRELCKIINISQTNYSKYELEKINIPLDTLRKLAEFFCTSTDYILGLTDEQTPYPRIKENKKIS